MILRYYILRMTINVNYMILIVIIKYYYYVARVLLILLFQSPRRSHFLRLMYQDLGGVAALGGSRVEIHHHPSPCSRIDSLVEPAINMDAIGLCFS